MRTFEKQYHIGFRATKQESLRIEKAVEKLGITKTELLLNLALKQCEELGI